MRINAALPTVLLIGLALSPMSHAQEEPKKLSSRALSSKFEKTWTRFVDDFRNEKQTRARLKLIDDYSRQTNDLFAPYLADDAIRRVLPILADTRLIDLEPTFLGVSREHPDDRVKAAALLHFAQYLGNNRRTEECDVTLKHLRNRFGKLKFGRSTFAKAAEEAGHYFKHLAIGCAAPPTTGSDADGTMFSLSDYKGKVVMLRFWGDWCPACRAMYPYERDITKKYRNRPFALIGVNSDPKKRCRDAQNGSQLTWRSFWDGGNTTGPIANLYQIEDWPRIIIIDSEGVIRMNARGLDRKYVSAMLDQLIQEAEQRVTKNAA